MRGLLSLLLHISLVAGVAAQDAGNPGRGFAFAELHCAACHGIQPAEQRSPKPGLATFQRIADTPGMTGTALSVWLRTPHKEMPDLIIAPDDRTNVIAYILSMREPRRLP